MLGRQVFRILFFWPTGLKLLKLGITINKGVSHDSKPWPRPLPLWCPRKPRLRQSRHPSRLRPNRPSPRLPRPQRQPHQRSPYLRCLLRRSRRSLPWRPSLWVLERCHHPRKVDHDRCPLRQRRWRRSNRGMCQRQRPRQSQRPGLGVHLDRCTILRSTCLFLGPEFSCFSKIWQPWMGKGSYKWGYYTYIYIYTITTCLRILLALLLDTVNPSVYAIITSTWVYKTHEISGDQTWQWKIHHL